jgi:prolycopene isomerase
MMNIIKFVKLIKVPVEDYLAAFIQDKQLIRLLSVGYRGNPTPFSLTFIYTMMDYYYPGAGGVQAIPDLLAGFIIENGGEVRYKTSVEKIIIENNKASGVVLKNGDIIRGKFVVNNGDLRRTLSNMISGKDAPAGYTAEVMKSRVGESVFSVYLGVDIPPEEIPTQGCPHIFLVPSYENYSLTELNTNPDFYRKVLLMISVPTLLDKKLAPEGKSILILQCAASIRSFNNWGTKNGKRTEKYKALKKEIASQLIANAERLIPGLSKKIEVQVESTPLTLNRYTLNSEGAACGWTYHPAEAFTGGLKGITKNTNTGIENLYQVGHWTMSPGGAPAGLITGKLVSSTIRKRIKTGKI